MFRFIPGGPALRNTVMLSAICPLLLSMLDPRLRGFRVGCLSPAGEGAATGMPLDQHRRRDEDVVADWEGVDGTSIGRRAFLFDRVDGPSRILDTIMATVGGPTRRVVRSESGWMSTRTGPPRAPPPPLAD